MVPITWICTWGGVVLVCLGLFYPLKHLVRFLRRSRALHPAAIASAKGSNDDAFLVDMQVTAVLLVSGGLTIFIGWVVFS